MPRDLVRALTSCANIGRRARPCALVVSICLTFATTSVVMSADLVDGDQLFKAGKYAECVELAEKAIAEYEYRESWRHLKIRSELALGRYGDALETLDNARERFKYSLQLRWLAREVYLYNGQPDRAEVMLDEINELVQRSRWRYTDAANLVTLGQYYIQRGIDPKKVLDRIYDQIKQKQPNFLETYLVTGQLALEKHDYQLAAEAYAEAVKRDPSDPDAHFGLARAFAASDPEKSEQELSAALERNPQHAEALLFIVDRQIDAERYAEAEQGLEKVLAVNPHHPLAWAYRAVLAHLSNQPEQEKDYRDKALRFFHDNPEVDHLIGRKLSQKYRFAEGARFQRSALEMAPDYLPAKLQLSQDLLRLGDEKDGWQLADDVYDKDGYNVVAHNLVTLQDNLDGFVTLQGHGFVVRMEPREARIYGHRVLRLLGRAKEYLCQKYDVQVEEPTFVEIFPKQQDFAIRTFGLPGGAGFLGVCFGRVITANSPASQTASPTSWEAVLWHEFCHVVTLQKTLNKMPRWLSEGISVYEEQLADPTWGQSMTPKYREMVLGEDLTPVSELSAAFLNPPSPVHLQFAYFESAMVVEYLVEQYGLETLKRILVDLGAGMPINDSLARYAGSMEALDKEFAEHARQRAQLVAPKVDWNHEDLPKATDPGSVEGWLQKHPNNFWGLQILAQQLLRQRQWQAAKAPLERLVELYPEYDGPDSPYVMLANVHRELGETADERAALEKLATVNADNVDALLRLMELCSEAADWPATVKYAERVLAVNPLQPAPHRFMAKAAESLGDDARAIEAYQSLLLMDPLDPAETHYRLASMLYRGGQLDAARKHVVRSLEEAPRFRDAHRLLLQVADALNKPSKEDGSAGTPVDTESVDTGSTDAESANVKSTNLESTNVESVETQPVDTEPAEPDTDEDLP